MFINVTAAYDTAEHRGFVCKLLQLLPDKHIVKMMMEISTIAVLPSPLMVEEKADHGVVLKSAFLRALLWPPLLSNVWIRDLQPITSMPNA